MRPYKTTRKVPKPMLLVIILGMMVLSACEQDGKAERWYIPDEKVSKDMAAGDTFILWGNWVCKDFIELATAKQSVWWVKNRPMFYEIVFKPEYGDSALLITGYEDFFVKWTKGADNEYLLKNILPDRDIVLQVPKGMKDLQLTDTLRKQGKEQIHNWTYGRAPEEYMINNGRYTTAMAGYINNALIKGDYLPAGGGSGIPVTFEANGIINGWPLYERYRICMGGDCYRLTRNPFDVVQLIGSQKTDYYGMVSTANGDSLYLYRLESEGKEGGDYSYKPQEPLAFKKLPQ